MSYCGNCGMKIPKTIEGINELNNVVESFLKEEEKEEKPEFNNDYSLYQTKIDNLEEEISEQKEIISEYREEEEKRDNRNANVYIITFVILCIGVCLGIGYVVYSFMEILPSLSINPETLLIMLIPVIIFVISCCYVALND